MYDLSKFLNISNKFLAKVTFNFGSVHVRGYTGVGVVTVGEATER